MVKLNILKKFSLGLFTVYVIMLLVVIYLTSQLQFVRNQTRILYVQPYLVSNTIKDIQTKIYDYANQGIDIHFASNQSQLNRLKAETAKKDKFIQESFKIVSLKYHGDKNLVDSASAAYTDWKMSFNKLYEIKEENKTDSNYIRILLESHKKIEKTNFFLSKISDFAKMTA